MSKCNKILFFGKQKLLVFLQRRKIICCDNDANKRAGSASERTPKPAVQIHRNQRSAGRRRTGERKTRAVAEKATGDCCRHAWENLGTI